MERGRARNASMPRGQLHAEPSREQPHAEPSRHQLHAEPGAAQAAPPDGERRPGHWRVLRSQPLVERQFLRVRQDHVLLPNGKELEDFSVVSSPPWAAVVCVTEGGQLVLVEQYRHGLGGLSLELPAGALESGEASLDGARRELLEETGYEAAEWRSMGVMLADPSRNETRAHLHLALGARPVGPPALDPTEELEVRVLSPSQVLQSIASGELCHGIHVAALLRARLEGHW